ncbi:hypothetical protein IEQ34_011009 [Dendrobium chrysotoxum]|uniref:Cyclic nucleotide-binding domain-containing protein n=1 Tax=Dendrobium chrysotoxum TaxID=161865 RepID=A0AAV7GUF1_DENCH|nr:hypothetical protein IEQ34_011009 [Dendrobium chrysotoxum]
MSTQGNREFLNEIGMISALQYPNLVRLYGCCVEENQLLLVYEYLENNSLADALFSPEKYQLKLDWSTRQKICAGIARVKADVYSYGIVALEIVAGKSVTRLINEGNIHLLDWVHILREKEELPMLVDKKLGLYFSKEEGLRMIKVALLCSNSSPALRPPISMVVSMLTSDISIQNFVSYSGILGEHLAQEIMSNPRDCLRRLEMQLRRRDVEQWMSHRRLPEELRRKVRQAERFCWAATRGVNEEELLEKLPEDLQRDIRRHFFSFLKKVRIFSLMDEPVLDAVFEKLGQTLYIGGSDILYQGGPIDKMVFIVRGKLESIGADGNVAPLSEGDVCGEELLTWCLEHSSANKAVGRVRFSGQRLFSNRTVKCLTNVEAFALRAADLEEVTVIFSRFLRNPRVQGAIRYESPYWRYVAATRIQVAWRYRQWRLKRANKFSKGPSHSSHLLSR